MATAGLGSTSAAHGRRRGQTRRESPVDLGLGIGGGIGLDEKLVTREHNERSETRLVKARVR